MQFVRRSLAPLCVVGALAWNGCAAGNGSYTGNATYPQSAIQLEGMESLQDGSLRIRYRTPAETMYFCPGIDVVEDPAGVLKVTFVRAPLSSRKTARFAGTIDPATGIHQVLLPDAANKQVILVGGEQERVIQRRGG